MILIADLESYKAHATLIESFKGLYIKGFPDINEREDFDVILNRVFGDKQTNEPHSIIILSITGDDKPEVTGGLVADWYANSQAIHLIYLINDEKFRGKGIAKKLINEGVISIKNWIKKEKGIDIKNVFFESNNPLKTKQENDSFDPVKRLEIFSHLGAKLINIPYVQPALDKKKEEVENLFLLSFTQFNASGEKIQAIDISSFLFDLYLSLGENETNKSLIDMNRHLERIKDKNGDIALESLVENPYYRFIKSSVTFHFIEKDDVQSINKNDIGLSCSSFSSFEADLFNYQNQKEPPFRTVFKEFSRNAVVIFPSIYNYTSEGKSHTKITQSNRTSLNINLSVSQSVIEKSRKKIYHITLTPASDNYFTELDLIKLSSFFGSKQEDSSVFNQIRFKIGESDAQLSPANLLGTYFNNLKESQLESLSTGIIQIDLNEVVTNEKTDFHQFVDIFKKDEKHKLTSTIKNFSKALCGIVLGIFDFERMDDDEIYDTILPIVSKDESFMAICRGTLLKISIEEDFMSSIPKHIIISPYMLIANAVLSYNEYILRDLKKNIDGLLEPKSESKLHELELCQMNARNVLNYQYLHDIFQYPSEKEIIETGNLQRGLNNLYNVILKRVDELAELIEITKTKKSKLPEALINALLTFIAVMQLKGLFDELLKETYSDSFIYVFTVVVALVVASAIFGLVWMKKK